ncbi:hypothetical protein ABZ249_25415 [Nocardiopsis sp. NPDC006139]|uniref:hypothetical protein n=1 Tax=Nocardiopsis sp. NPDC006139 TaxID=3154578 RepID=UPI0033A7B4CD
MDHVRALPHLEQPANPLEATMPATVPVRVLLQVADNEPNEVGQFVVTDPSASGAETAQALRELADEIENPTS